MRSRMTKSPPNFSFGGHLLLDDSLSEIEAIFRAKFSRGGAERYGNILNLASNQGFIVVVSVSGRKFIT